MPSGLKMPMIPRTWGVIISQFQIYLKPLFAFVYKPMTIMPIYLWLTLLGLFVLKMMKKFEEKSLFMTMRTMYLHTWMDSICWGILKGSAKLSVATDILMFFMFGGCAWAEGYTTFYRAVILTGRQYLTLMFESDEEDFDIIDPKNALPSSLNQYVRLTNDLSSRSAKTEYDVQKINLQLETCRKSILSIVNPSEPETPTVHGLKKSLKESIEELKECLECTICCENFEDMKVFACTKDHWICARCLPHTEMCPSCREDFNVQPPTRRVTCEKVLAMVKEHLSLCDG